MFQCDELCTYELGRWEWLATRQIQLSQREHDYLYFFMVFIKLI